MKKKRGSGRKARPAEVIGHRSRYLYDAAEIAATKDVAHVLAKYRDPGMALKTYDHAPRGARLVEELTHLLTKLDSPIRDQAMWYINKLRGKFLMPRRYRFYPRDHVPSGCTPYDEEFVRVEYFSSINTGNPQSPRITPASGFASFNPGSGVFSSVGYAMGSTADVRSGPIVTMETNQHAADIWLTSYFLLDYQYQLSASLNPAFHGEVSKTESSSVTLDLLLEIEIRTLSGSPISVAASAIKPIKHAELQPGSTLPPFIAGPKEIVPGTQLQGGELAVPVTWEHVFSAPANCRISVGVVVAPLVSSSGYRGSKDFRYLCIADGRASGQVTWVEALLFAE